MDARSLMDSPIVRTRDGGFALPIVVFALVVLGVIGVAALQSTRDELLSAQAVSNSSQAFYAAEAGLHTAVSNWDQDAMDTLVANPGDSLVGSWTTIENRCSYQLVYRRIDGAPEVAVMGFPTCPPGCCPSSPCPTCSDRRRSSGSRSPRGSRSSGRRRRAQ